jgi:hypothetical protein
MDYSVTVLLQFKLSDMGEACSTYGGDGKYKISVETLKKRDLLGVFGIDGRLILK